VRRNLVERRIDEDPANCVRFAGKIEVGRLAKETLILIKRRTHMQRFPLITRTLATAAAASAILWNGAAQAVTPATLSVGDTVIMVCHESGGSGLPLTDYINNMDIAAVDSQGNFTQQLLRYSANQKAAVFNLETSSSPTTCALATAELVAFWGYTLTSVFSHFTGYYIEVFTH
jgi:hypothetical protein